MTESDFYIWLGSKFKTLREEADLTKAQIARKIGVSPGLLSQFENDGKKISAFRVNQLLKAFNLSSIEELLDPEKKNEIHLTISGSEVNAMDKSTLEKVKETLRLMFFSTEAYDAVVKKKSGINGETAVDECDDGEHCPPKTQLNEA